MVSVNLLTEKLIVERDTKQAGPRLIIDQLREVGYEAVLTGNNDQKSEAAALKANKQAELKRYIRMSLSCVVFAVPAILFSMVFPYISVIDKAVMTPIGNTKLSVNALILWFLLTPVQFSAGPQFYRSAFAGLRHGKATVSLLVTIGTASG